MKVLNEVIKNSKVSLSYLGNFSDEITANLIGISEFYIANRTDLGKLKNKVSFLIAECFQNIVRHKDLQVVENSIQQAYSDLFQINIFSDRAILSSSNLIEDRLVPDLTNKLEHVNSLDPNALKDYFKATLVNNEISKKGGAGLGLIEMARKSGLPLRFSFKPYEQGYSRFFLSLETASANNNASEIFSINDLEDLYANLLSEKTLIHYKGDLSAEYISPFIDLFQKNFTGAQGLKGKEKRCVTILIESLQNVAKHAKPINGITEGMFSVKAEGDSFSLSISNTIPKKDKTTLETILSEVHQLSIDDIKTRYNEKLVEPEFTVAGNCGLGILEIARSSGGNFSYAFIPTSDEDVLFTLNVTV